MTADPFRHHPALRPKIIDPESSSFRTFTTERLAAEIAALGLPGGWWRSDEAREATRQQALDGRWGRDLWVFAYGSLMWDPGFRFTDLRRARAPRHERRFILRDTRGARGTPDRPGLMAALDDGDGCDGLAMKIAGATLDAETEILWRREMIAPAYQPRFITLEIDGSTVEALAFLADHQTDFIDTSLSPAQQAACIATGSGILGSSLEYVSKICAQCEALGIRDEQMVSLLAAAQHYRATIAERETT